MANMGYVSTVDRATEIAIFPWLGLKEPITVCGVTWYPRANAIAQAASLSAHVAAATSYFYDHYRSGSTALGHPLELVPLRPSIVFFGADLTQARVELATQLHCLATIFANSPVSYANSTTFEHFYQRLGGEPTVSARRTRRMHGSALSGAMAENLIDTRPAWCGGYHAPSASMLQALEAVADLDDAKPIREAVEALMLATQDADVTPASAEHAHYARALERLLHRTGQRRQGRRKQQRDLAASLLKPLLKQLKDQGNETYANETYAIVRARDAAISQRNAFWHPEGAADATYPFEKQAVVRPNLIAFRAAAALIIATIWSLDPDAVDDRLFSYVSSVEDWIGGIVEDDPGPSSEASEIGMEWSRRFHHRRALAAMRAARETPDVRAALDALGRSGDSETP